MKYESVQVIFSVLICDLFINIFEIQLKNKKQL